MNNPEPPGKLLVGIGGLVGFYLLAPLVVVVGMSLNASNELSFPPTHLSTRWYHELLSSPQWTHAIGLSVRLGLLVAAISVLLGYLIAVGLDRSGFRGKGLVVGVVMSPLLVPYVVVGVALYFVFSEWHIVGTFNALLLADVALALPYVVINVLASLQLVDRDLERAAQSLGASPVRAFLRVAFPLTLPGLFAGAVFAFVTSWDEVIVAIFVHGPETNTLPIVMWSQLRSVIDPTIAAVATGLMLVTVLALILGALAMTYGRRLVGVK